jgi:hypothetical protein
VSPFVYSDGIIVDTTPPVQGKRVKCHQNSLSNLFFSILFKHKNESKICDDISETKWKTIGKTCVSLRKSDSTNSDTTVLHIQGSMSQDVTHIAHGKYRLTFYTSTIPSDDLKLSAVEGYVQVKEQRHVFMIYRKPSVQTYSWQKHIYFFHVFDESMLTVEVGTLSPGSAFAVNDIQFQHCSVVPITEDGSLSNVDVEIVFVHDWSSIHAEWNFTDPETEIVNYAWAIGTSEQLFLLIMNGPF